MVKVIPNGVIMMPKKRAQPQARRERSQNPPKKRAILKAVRHRLLVLIAELDTANLSVARLLNKEKMVKLEL